MKRLNTDGKGVVRIGRYTRNRLFRQSKQEFKF